MLAWALLSPAPAGARTKAGAARPPHRHGAKGKAGPGSTIQITGITVRPNEFGIPVIYIATDNPAAGDLRIPSDADLAQLEPEPHQLALQAPPGASLSFSPGLLNGRGLHDEVGVLDLATPPLLLRGRLLMLTFLREIDEPDNRDMLEELVVTGQPPTKVDPGLSGLEISGVLNEKLNLKGMNLKVWSDPTKPDKVFLGTQEQMNQELGGPPPKCPSCPAPQVVIPKYIPYELHYCSPDFAVKMLQKAFTNEAAVTPEPAETKDKKSGEPKPPAKAAGAVDQETIDDLIKLSALNLAQNLGPLSVPGNFSTTAPTDLVDQIGKDEKPVADDLDTAEKDYILIANPAGDDTKVAQFRQVIAYLQNYVDIPPEYITLDVWVCEIRDQALKDLGLDLNSSATTPGTTNRLAVEGVGASFDEHANARGLFDAFNLGSFFRNTGLEFNLFLNTLISKDQAQLIAHQTLSTVDGYEVRYVAQDQIPFIGGQTISGTPTVAVAYKNVGMQLKFLPRLVPDENSQAADSLLAEFAGRFGTPQNPQPCPAGPRDKSIGKTLTIRIGPKVSAVTEMREVSPGVVAPVVEERELGGIIRVKTDEVFCLANIVRDEDRQLTKKIPLLGDLKVVGKLFRSQRHEHEHSHIYIFVKPHINVDSLCAETQLPCQCSAGDGQE